MRWSAAAMHSVMRGNCPKVLLWIMEEFFYILHDLTEEESDGHVTLGFELMIEAEHRYRIKQGGGIRCCCSPSHASSTLPCSQEMLECITWGKPDSKTLEGLVWSVYDGLLSLGPTPKLAGPKSYNQVTRCLAAKVFRGLQVHCSARTSAQFNELPPPKVRSVVLAPPQSEITRKTETMDTASPKVEDTEEGTVGGELCVDWTSTQWHGCVTISTGMMMKWFTSGPYFTHWWIGKEPWLSTWHAAFYQCGTGPPSPTHVLPSHPNQYGNQVMVAIGLRGK